MIINLDETMITETIIQRIVSGLSKGKKQFGNRHDGVVSNFRAKMMILQNRTGVAVKFLNDYEKAKEWVSNGP